jgi:signal transduction histidine kinase
MERDVTSVARALHDGISQDLIALAYRLEMLALSPGLSSAQIRELRTASHEVTLMTSKVRKQIFLLRQSFDGSFSESLQRLKEETATEVIFKLPEDISPIPNQLHLPLLHLLTEAVRNADSHAGASRIEVELFIEENLIHLNISDNGRGGVLKREGHYGLQGMQEIAENLGGDFALREVDGTQICVSFPISQS